MSAFKIANMRKRKRKRKWILRCIHTHTNAEWAHVNAELAQNSRRNHAFKIAKMRKRKIGAFKIAKMRQRKEKEKDLKERRTRAELTQNSRRNHAFKIATLRKRRSWRSRKLGEFKIAK